MIAYVGQTRAGKLIARLEALGLGECTNRGEFPPRRSPWFLDNGAFSDWTNGKPWDGTRWRSDLERAREHDPPPVFGVVPDIVGGGLPSLARSVEYLPVMGNVPGYLAVQDGMLPADVGPVLDGFAGLFVGGTLPWKLRTGSEWVEFAHAQGLPCHIGRVGTAGRVRWAIEIGADSIDSSLPLWSEENLQRFLGALRGNGQAYLWPRL